MSTKTGGESNETGRGQSGFGAQVGVEKQRLGLKGLVSKTGPEIAELGGQNRVGGPKNRLGIEQIGWGLEKQLGGETSWG